VASRTDNDIGENQGDEDINDDGSSQSSISSLSDYDTTGSSTESVLGSGHMNLLTIMMLVGAIMALMASIYAVTIGQRKIVAKEHPLRGSLDRRIKCFNRFAGSDNLCGGNYNQHNDVNMNSNYSKSVTSGGE
jgi:hypothetical protein